MHIFVILMIFHMFSEFSFAENLKSSPICILDGTYVDRDFPPSDKSLYNKGNSKLHRSELKLWQSFEWVRPEEFMSGDISLFVGEPTVDSIKEGYLGNSYFVSAIRALCEKPNSIKRLFDTTKTKDGQYKVNFCLNGQNFKIIVDDFIPFNPKTKSPAFSSSKQNELWVMLLEKAWAKVSGSYENSINGLCCEVFRALTGAPVEYLKHKYVNDVWKMVKSAYYNKHTICCLPDNESPPSAKSDYSDFFSSYAFPVMAVYQYKNDEGEAKIVRIRNNNKSKWSDVFKKQSLVLFADLKQNLYEFEDIDDVSKEDIFMSLEDYACYFKSTLVCYTQHVATATSLKCRHLAGESN